MEHKKASRSREIFQKNMRWRFCQNFARDLYRSDMSDDALKSVAGTIATAMRAREDEMHLHSVDFDEPSAIIE